MIYDQNLGAENVAQTSENGLTTHIGSHIVKFVLDVPLFIKVLEVLKHFFEVLIAFI